MIAAPFIRSVHSRATPAQFSAAPWTTSAVTLTANNLLSPDGRTNATRVAQTAATDYHFIKKTMSTYTSGVSYIMEAYVKAYGAQQWVYMDDSYFGSCYYDIVNGVVGNKGSNTGNARIVNLGDGWFYIAHEFTNPAVSNNYAILPVTANGGALSFAGTATNGFYIWKSDCRQGYVPGFVPVNTTIRPNADSSAGSWTTAPLYSKVNDSSDATFITASANTTCVLGMAPTGGPGTAATSVLTIRCGKSATGGNSRTISAVVKKSGTTIDTLAATTVPETMADITMNLTLSTDLSSGITIDLTSGGTTGGGGNARSVNVAEVSIAVTY